MARSSFVRVLQGLESTLTASHIAAFPLWTCKPDEDAKVVWDIVRPEARDFSHVPVRDDRGHVKSVVDRAKLKGKSGPIRQFVVDLLEDQVVDSALPLRETMRRLKRDGFLLVRSPEAGFPDNLSGIINHADVQTAPVRLLLYARFAEIEERLRAVVREERLDGELRRVALEARRRHRNEMSLLHNLSIAGLLRAAADQDALTAAAPRGDALRRAGRRLKKVRDAVSHHFDVRTESAAPSPTASVRAVLDAFQLADDVLAHWVP